MLALSVILHDADILASNGGCVFMKYSVQLNTVGGGVSPSKGAPLTVG